MATVDIVIPVFGALGALRRCVDSVLASSGKAQYEIAIYDDETDEQRLARRKARWTPTVLVEAQPSA